MENIEEVARKLQQIRMMADECLSQLDVHLRSTLESKGSSRQQKNVRATNKMDFSKPVRPFIKQYSKGMSGSKKFTLLLARLAGGEPTKEVALEEIATHWNKMSALMESDFNRFFSSEAKDNDWVESQKRGFYNLRPEWKSILETNN